MKKPDAATPTSTEPAAARPVRKRNPDESKRRILDAAERAFARQAGPLPTVQHRGPNATEQPMRFPLAPVPTLDIEIRGAVRIYSPAKLRLTHERDDHAGDLVTVEAEEEPETPPAAQ